jgi:hydrogenase nickel incorporation protein HypA/HybF
MHELSIAVQVVQSAEKAVPLSHKGRKVLKITLDVGKMAGVMVHSLRFCFEIAARGTALEGSELVVREIPVTAECRSCLSPWTMDDPEFICPSCGGNDVELKTGRELFIRSMDVADE